MVNMLALIILFPLISFVVLAISQGRYSNKTSSVLGVGGIGISMFLTMYVIYGWYYSYNDYVSFLLIQEYCSWFKVDTLNIKIILRLDILSLLMLSVIIGIGFIIHVYAVWYMSGCKGYSRFFAYTNLFISSMILLVLSDNLLLMYFGWEIVGLCSYLLIGFYFSDYRNGIQACKAFIMTRFGDICLMYALFMIYNQYHTLNLNELLQLNSKDLCTNVSTWISIALLIGSIGKSAQIPLQTWLVNAMVGPTPVSALIHSATMVTAGVYLISRMHNFLLVTPGILYIVSLIGVITVIVAGCSALFQSNIKKILAYSTISQIGYMFLAMGEKNWNGAICHLITHAIFKSLLFLSAGSLIRACQNEQNIFKMGGLYKTMPFVYICFLVGGASLSGFPFVTSGFYSKELILLNIFNNNDYCFLFLGLIGIFITSIYIFRMIFIIFHGKQLIQPKISYEICQYLPLFILLLLSTCIGSKAQFFLIDSFNTVHVFFYNKTYLIIISEMLVFFGIWMAYIYWVDNELYRSKYIRIKNHISTIFIRYLVLLFHYGGGIDWIYRIVFIKPYIFILNKLSYYNNNVMANKKNMFILFACWIGRCLSYIEYGKLNWYIASIGFGAIVVLFIVFMNVYI